MSKYKQLIQQLDDEIAAKERRNHSLEDEIKALRAETSRLTEEVLAAVTIIGSLVKPAAQGADVSAIGGGSQLDPQQQVPMSKYQEPYQYNEAWTPQMDFTPTAQQDILGSIINNQLMDVSCPVAPTAQMVPPADDNQDSGCEVPDTLCDFINSWTTDLTSPSSSSGASGSGGGYDSGVSSPGSDNQEMAFTLESIAFFDQPTGFASIPSGY